LVTGGTAALLSAILSIEPVRQLFHFGPLHADDVDIAIASGAVVLGLLAALQHLIHHRLDTGRSVACRASIDCAWSRPAE
jgi:hypothetical protein